MIFKKYFIHNCLYYGYDQLTICRLKERFIHRGFLNYWMILVSYT